MSIKELVVVLFYTDCNVRMYGIESYQIVPILVVEVAEEVVDNLGSFVGKPVVGIQLEADAIPGVSIFVLCGVEEMSQVHQPY